MIISNSLCLNRMPLWPPNAWPIMRCLFWRAELPLPRQEWGSRQLLLRPLWHRHEMCCRLKFWLRKMASVAFGQLPFGRLRQRGYVRILSPQSFHVLFLVKMYEIPTSTGHMKIAFGTSKKHGCALTRSLIYLWVLSEWSQECSQECS